MKRALPLAVVAVALAAIVWIGIEMVRSRPRVSAPSAADVLGVDRTDIAAPAVELVDMDGKPFSLAAAKGEVVFVNFWATWCPPCRDEMPSMVALGRDLATRYPGRFRMVAVSVDEGWEPVREFFASPPYFGKSGVTVALDADQAVTKAYYCAARGGKCPDLKFPESYIVDKSGRLVAYVVGPRDWSNPAARAFLEGLIGS